MEYKLLKNKHGFLLRDFVVTGIIFGLVIALYVVLVASTANQYNNTDIISPSFAQHYSNLNTNLQQLNSANSISYFGFRKGAHSSIK